MRVAFGSIYPYDESRVRGGIQAVALSLTRALAKRPDVELHVVSCNSTVKRSTIERRGPVTFHWLPTLRRLYVLRAATWDAWRVNQTYARIRPDIIHAQGFSEYALVGHSATPMLLTVHGVEMLVPWMKATHQFRGLAGAYRRRMGSWMARKGLDRAQGVVSIAGGYLPSVLGDRLSSKRVYAIFNPTSDDFFQLERPARQQAREVLWAGVISERKNVVELIQVFERVHRQIPEACLKMAGPIVDPQYFRRVKHEIEACRLSQHVCLLGFADQPKLLEAYRRAAVLALTSLEEAAPMVIAQAMAAGMPVVASRVGGIPWMIEDGQTGYVVERQDIQAMATHLVELLSDESRCRQMGLAAREAAKQHFAADLVAEQTVMAYRELTMTQAKSARGQTL